VLREGGETILLRMERKIESVLGTLHNPERVKLWHSAWDSCRMLEWALGLKPE